MPTLRKILASESFHKTAVGQKTDLQGIIDGYQRGVMKMFGPLVDVGVWAQAMMDGGAAEYNGFEVGKVLRWLKSRGIRKVNPAREYSVALYFPLPRDADPAKFLRGRPAGADEVSTQLGGPDGKRLDGNWYSKSPYYETTKALEEGSTVWVRMWWD